MRRTSGLAVTAVVLTFVGLACLPRGSRADEPAEPPATVAVEKGPFTVVVDMDGAFDAKDAVEVAYKPEGHEGELDLEVVEAVTSGPVEAGRPLVRFKADKMEEDLREAEAEVNVARANLAHQVKETERQEETTAVALKKAEHEKASANEALKTFTEVERALKTKESEHEIQTSKDGIQDQIEELAQLEKMYKADEVIEETEEIVLKRTRRNLERSKESLDFETKRHDLLVRVELPRQLESLTVEQRSADHAWDLAQATGTITVEQARAEVEKAKRSLERQEKAYARRKKDLDGLVLTARVAGVVVAGSLEHGKWTRTDELRKSLKPGGHVKAGETLLTIVKPGAVRVRALLPEANYFDVHEGMKAEVTATSAASQPLEGRVAQVSSVAEEEKFEVAVDVASADAKWMPGLTCKVKVTAATKPTALTVPAKSVGKEGDESYVEVWGDDPSGRTKGKAKRVPVKVGATSGGRTEILEGVKAGDKVLEKASKDD